MIRRFVRGDPGLVGEVATRIAGSADLYAPGGRLPGNGINFITCHDGFTLKDLVSYNEKHNHENGEDNRDGSNDNLSWNCGVEGETSDPAVLRLRHRQARNFLAILLLSQGVPMVLSGDEVLRSRRGNNNAWCQDYELSWFDWRQVEAHADMLRFVRELIALRKRHHPSCAGNASYRTPGTGGEAAGRRLARRAPARAAMARCRRAAAGLHARRATRQRGVVARDLQHVRCRTASCRAGVRACVR